MDDDVKQEEEELPVKEEPAWSQNVLDIKMYVIYLLGKKNKVILSYNMME